jgi:hypothetical protein
MRVGVADPTRAGSDGPSTGHSEKSPLIAYVSGKAPESEMPPSAVRDRFRSLSPDEVALLRAWIDQGPVADGRVAHSANN